MTTKSKMKKIILTIYYIAISYLLLKPGGDSIAPFIYFDKLVHFSFFAILGILLSLNFKINKKIIIIITCYAVTTEILQHIMGLGRSFDFFDIVADFVGLLAGIIIFYFIKKRLTHINVIN